MTLGQSLSDAWMRAEDLDEMNIEIMRNTLYKAYLDDFSAFCTKLGGTTAEVMGNLLSFEVGLSYSLRRQSALGSQTHCAVLLIL